MLSIRPFRAALIAAALVLSPFAAGAQSFSDAQRGEIEAVIKKYLVEHPEVIAEALAELEKRQAEVAAERHRKAVKEQAETIFNSPRHVVIGNRKGDVNLVEFFDYNCGYCKRAMKDMLDLMKADPNVRVVLKEFPVLGQQSVEAATVAVAVRMQDTDGKKYLDFHQKMLSGRGQADKARAMAVAKEVGLDMARLEKDMAGPEIRATLAESFKLADALGLSGTPAYVVGEEVVVGAIGLDGLKTKVSYARCGKPTC